MKMSNVFDLPLVHTGDTGNDSVIIHQEIVTDLGDIVIGEYSSMSRDEAKAAVHAVNCYDDLVESLRSIIDKSRNGFATADDLDIAAEALTKAGVEL